MCLQIFIHTFRHFPWPGHRGDDPDFSVDLTWSTATIRTPEILYIIHRNCYTSGWFWFQFSIPAHRQPATASSSLRIFQQSLQPPAVAGTSVNSPTFEVISKCQTGKLFLSHQRSSPVHTGIEMVGTELRLLELMCITLGLQYVRSFHEIIMIWVKTCVIQSNSI